MTEKAPSEFEAEDALLLHFARNAFNPYSLKSAGVAVSGGGDSLSLLHLLARIAPEAGFALEAATVDHGLRPDAATEARGVAKLCKKLGIRHETLRWEHGIVTGNLQDAARRARYDLIASWAQRRKIGHVALGHTADDQAETFLMELAREAGIDGLSAMRPRWEDRGIVWHRPLLSVSRAALRAYLARRGLTWADDPSNENERFARVRARKALAALAPLGITAVKLGHTAAHLSSARAALEYAAQNAAERIGRTVAGEVIYARRDFRLLPPEIARRLLVGALLWVSGAEYPPRGAEIARLELALWEGRARTLGGCRIRATETQIRIARESKAAQGVAAKPGAVWDGRWRLKGPKSGKGLEIRALGAEGLRQCLDWRETQASREALIASPALWRGQILVSAPLAGRPEGWTARPVRPFPAIFLRH